MKHYLIGALAIIILSSCVGNQVWEKPEVLFSNSTLTVNRVDFQTDRTVFNLTIQGQAGSSFRIKSSVFLSGDKGHEYVLTGSEGLTLDQLIPYSEEVNTFNLYFEPVNGSERALDLIEPHGWMIYGIHDAAKPLRIKPAKEKSAVILDETAFFKKGIGHLSGRFEGANHPEMIQFYGNNVFQENNLQSCQVAPDGSFSLEPPLEHPILSIISGEKSSSYYHFFLAPDVQTDLRIDSTGMAHYPVGTRCGKLAAWLSNAAPSLSFHLWEIPAAERDTLGFRNYSARLERHYESIQTLADYVSDRLDFSVEETHLLKQKIRMLAAIDELGAVLDLPPAAVGGPDDLTNPSLYNITARLNPSDWSAFMLSNDSYTLSNRYEFSGPRRIVRNVIPKEVAMDSAFFRQAGPSIFLQAVLMNGRGLSQEVQFKNMGLMARPSTRSVGEDGRTRQEGDDWPTVWNERISAMTSPYLKERFQSTLNELLAETDRYDLPDGEATDIFRRLVDPFRGKWVYVDFWDIGCGPCRYGIENSVALRKKIAGMNDLELVFITGDRSTPKEVYEEYVSTNLVGETSYLIPETENILLYSLFKFNGIPHNELVDPDGRIVRGKSLPRLEYSNFLEQLELVK